MTIPVSHTRCPLQVHRDTLVLIIVLSFGFGATVATWATLAYLLKGGAL